MSIVKMKKLQLAGLSYQREELLRRLQKSLSRSYSTISMNFSFALMMTCLGIIVILAVILASNYL